MPDHAPIPEATSCGTDVPDYVGLAWRCGTLSIQRMGGMLAPLTLILKDGRQISPLYLAPWAAAAIRPEWAAVAGGGAGDPYLHGYGSNVAWEWARVDSTSVELRCRYPETDDIEELVRRAFAPRRRTIPVCSFSRNG